MKQELKVEDLQTYIDKVMEDSVAKSIEEFIKIPNVTKSFYLPNDQEKWNAPVEKDGGYALLLKAAKHIESWVNDLGINGAHVTVKQGPGTSITPIIVTVIDSSGVGNNTDETFFFYGHFDKQPPMDNKDHSQLPQWHHGGPYTPEVVKEEGKTVKIYGRGGADDGYSTYATMVAIKALQELKVPLPRIVMITEGDEESGTGDVEAWIEILGSELGIPKLVFCLDSGTLDYDRFWLTNSLRGYLVISLKVKVLNESVHSGSGTGIVPTCFRIIRQLIERIERSSTGEMPQIDLQASMGQFVPLNRQKQIQELVEALGKNAYPHFKTVNNLETPLPGNRETVLLSTWRAQVETLAIEPYPLLQNSSNVITPEVSIKLSTRLPPTKDPKIAKQTAEALLTSNPPYNAEVSIIGESAADKGFNAPTNPDWLNQVFEEASMEAFNQKNLSMGQGGSIPFMNTLNELWPEAKFVITGLLGPESNAHAQDECLQFDYLKKLTASFALIIAKSIPHFQWTTPKQHKTHKTHGDHHVVEKVHHCFVEKALNRLRDQIKQKRAKPSACCHLK